MGTVVHKLLVLSRTLQASCKVSVLGSVKYTERELHYRWYKFAAVFADLFCHWLNVTWVSTLCCAHTPRHQGGLWRSVDILKHKKVNYCFSSTLFESFCNIIWVLLSFLLSKRKTVAVWVSSYILNTCNFLNKLQMNEKNKCVKQLISHCRVGSQCLTNRENKTTWLL